MGSHHGEAGIVGVKEIRKASRRVRRQVGLLALEKLRRRARFSAAMALHLLDGTGATQVRLAIVPQTCQEDGLSSLPDYSAVFVRADGQSVQVLILVDGLSGRFFHVAVQSIPEVETGSAKLLR